MTVLLAALRPYLVSMLAPLAMLVLGIWLGHAVLPPNCKPALAVATVAAQAKVQKDAQADITRAGSAGRGREQLRLQLDRVFTHLELDANHDAPAPVDACVLPAERLRRWADANVGAADGDTATAQPDDTAAAAAAAPVGPDARPGGQPPRGSPAVPPTGQPDVQSAGVSEGAQR